MIILALIGAGRWGRNYLSTIKNIPNAKIKYIADFQPLLDISSDYIKVEDYKNFLDKKDIQGVIIATPAFSHFKIASEFINRKINVLIEKPFTTSLSDAVKLKALNEKTGSVVMVGHIYRYNPAFLKLNELLPKIGKIKSIKSQGMNFGPFRDDVSALWDYGPHDISMITSILDSPISVSAKGLGDKNSKSYDNYSFKLKFSDNSFSTTTVGRKSKIKKRIFIVSGEKGEIVFDDLSKNKLTLKILGENTQFPEISDQSPLEAQLLEFIDCIAKNRKPSTDMEEGILTVKILETIDKSIKLNGKEVKIKD